jgi:hypothetical protein
VHTPCEDKSDDVKDSFYEELGRVFDQFPRYDMKISHEISNDNGLRVVNFAPSKNFVVKSTILSHCSIHKYTWTSPDGQTHNQIDHILIDRRRHSSIFDVRSFSGADCDTDHYLVFAKLRSDWE